MLNSIFLWFGLGLGATISALIGSILKSTTQQRIAGLISSGVVIVSVVAVFDIRQLWALPAVILDVILLINAGRLIAQHYHVAQIRQQVKRTAIGCLWLIDILLIIFLIVDAREISNSQIIGFLAISGSLITVLIAIQGLARLKSWRYRPDDNAALIELPTVSLLIPARNEDHALTQCLNAAVKSKYPKLEILVLDDCSQDTTAQIIRSFAHDGVRFVQGAQPDPNWLGKNSAYKLLSEEASGELLLFSGVDVLYSPDSINKLVKYFLNNNQQMVSVLPIRDHIDATSTLLQPLRYLKQLLTLGPRPPVLSSCWLIAADFLNTNGSFDAVRTAVVPETHFATISSRIKSYKFIIGTRRLGITTRKRLSSQLETATRTLFPLLKRSLIGAYISILILTWLSVMPFIIFIVFGFSDLIGVAAFIQILSITILQVFLMFSIRPASWWLGIIQLPLAVTLELSLILWSIWSYEFSSVYWKGRNICVPIYQSKD